MIRKGGVGWDLRRVAHDPQVIVKDGGHEKCAALIYQVPAIPGRLFREHRKGIYGDGGNLHWGIFSRRRCLGLRKLLNLFSPSANSLSSSDTHI